MSRANARTRNPAFRTYLVAPGKTHLLRRSGYNKPVPAYGQVISAGDGEFSDVLRIQWYGAAGQPLDNEMVLAHDVRRLAKKPMKNPRLMDRPATLRALYGDRQYRDYATPVLDVDFKPAVLKKLAAKGYVMQQGPHVIATWKGMTATEKGAGRFVPTAYGLEPTRGNGYALWDQQKGGWMSEAEFARRTGRASVAPYPVATKVFHSWQAAVDAAAGLNAPAPKKNPEGVNWNVRDFERDTRVRKRPYKPKLGTWVTIEIPRKEQPGANMELQYKGGKVLRYSGDSAVLLMAGEVRMPGEERGRSGREAWVPVRWLRPQGRKRRFNPRASKPVLFFKWSTPAPSWDGSIPKPWRVADLQALKTWMALGGYPDRVAYAEHDGDGMWVGVRDNRDSAKHAAELAALLGKLKAAGANAVGVKREGRIVGIRVRDRVKK